MRRLGFGSTDEENERRSEKAAMFLRGRRFWREDMGINGAS